MSSELPLEALDPVRGAALGFVRHPAQSPESVSIPSDHESSMGAGVAQDLTIFHVVVNA